MDNMDLYGLIWTFMDLYGQYELYSLQQRINIASKEKKNRKHQKEANEIRVLGLNMC